MASLRHIWRLESLRQEQIEPDYVKKARRDISSSVTGYFLHFDLSESTLTLANDLKQPRGHLANDLEQPLRLEYGLLVSF